jgi:hypothetical protein
MNRDLLHRGFSPGKKQSLKNPLKSRKAARFIERPFGRSYDYYLTTAPPSMPLASDTTHTDTSAHGHTNPSNRNQAIRAEMLFHSFMPNKPIESASPSQLQ